MKLAITLVLLAAACFGLAAREAMAQPIQVIPMPSIPHNWHPADTSEAKPNLRLLYGVSAPATKEVITISCTSGVTLNGKPYTRDREMIAALRKVANCPAKGAR